MKRRVSMLIVGLVFFFQFWPQYSGKSQLKSDSLLNAENQRLTDIRDALLDSINATVARVEHKQKAIVASPLKKRHKTKDKVRTRTVVKTVYVPKEVVKYRTKYISVPAKADYFAEMRRYNDSVSHKPEVKRKGFFYRLFHRK